MVLQVIATLPKLDGESFCSFAGDSTAYVARKETDDLLGFELGACLFDPPEGRAHGLSIRQPTGARCQGYMSSFFASAKVCLIDRCATERLFDNGFTAAQGTR